ncbi:unnamed protein product, partial [Laminaria digitata]
LRSDREKRADQVLLMRDRVVQLKRAVEEGQLKPLANRLFQVPAGKHTRVAVLLTLNSTGNTEELQLERTVERHIQMRLLNVNSSHLPPSLRRGAAAASHGAAAAAAAAQSGRG